MSPLTGSSCSSSPVGRWRRRPATPASPKCPCPDLRSQALSRLTARRGPSASAGIDRIKLRPRSKCPHARGPTAMRGRPERRLSDHDRGDQRADAQRPTGQGLAAPPRRPPPLNGELPSHGLPKASDEPKDRFRGRLSVVEPGPRPDELSELIDRALAHSEAILIDQPGEDSQERLSDLVVGSPLGVNAIEERLPFVSSQVLLHGADGMDCRAQCARIPFSLTAGGPGKPLRRSHLYRPARTGGAARSLPRQAERDIRPTRRFPPAASRVLPYQCCLQR